MMGCEEEYGDWVRTESKCGPRLADFSEQESLPHAARSSHTKAGHSRYNAPHRDALIINRGHQAATQGALSGRQKSGAPVL
jgi:hypothetical protein